MDNAFKVKKGLIVNGSGSTIVDIQGSSGQLFSITDSLTGTLFSVNDISGIPIMEVFSDDTVKLGTFNDEAIIVDGNTATIKNLDVTGNLTGDGSSLTSIDADTLDGQNGSYYRNASNLNAGTISDTRLPSSISSNTTGNATTATTATNLNRQVIAGNGLTGGGTLNANRTLTVGEGSGISVAASSVAVNSTVVRTSGNQTISGTKTFSSAVVLSTAGTATTHAVRADRNIAAGNGLTGGGNLTANRTFAVDNDVARGRVFSLGSLGSLTANATNNGKAVVLLFPSTGSTNHNIRGRVTTQRSSGNKDTVIADFSYSSRSTNPATPDLIMEQTRGVQGSRNRWRFATVDFQGTNWVCLYYDGSRFSISDCFISLQTTYSGPNFLTQLGVSSVTNLTVLTTGYGNKRLDGDFIASGDITSTGVVTGNGSGLTSLNGSNITTGTVADARIASTLVRTSRSISTGSGLSGGGNLTANRTFSVDSSVVRTSRSISTGSGLSGGGNLSANRTFSVDSSVVRTSRTLTAGNGLTGGGTLTGNRTFAVGAGSGISVAASSVAVNSTVVRTSGNQTIGGEKYFTDNVGIGTPSASKKLDVRGGVGTLALFKGSAINVNEHSAIEISNGFGSELTKRIRLSAIAESNFSNATALGLYTSPNSSSTIERLRIRANGNVGIGITSANDKLEVNGNIRANRFTDRNNTNYFVDPASTSQLNRIDIDSQIRHRGDTNTYMQFHTSDQWRVVTGGTERLEVNNSVITATRRLESTVEMRAPIFKDRNNTFRYVDPSNNGDSIRVSGDIVAYYSDIRLKDVEKNIPNPINKIKSLNGFYYTANEKAQKFGYKPNRQVGVSAQDVEVVLPEIIKDAPIGKGYKTLDYSKLTPLLIEGIKEQQTTIDKLENENKEQQQQIYNLNKRLEKLEKLIS